MSISGSSRDMSINCVLGHSSLCLATSFIFCLVKPTQWRNSQIVDSATSTPVVFNKLILLLALSDKFLDNSKQDEGCTAPGALLAFSMLSLWDTFLLLTPPSLVEVVNISADSWRIYISIQQVQFQILWWVTAHVQNADCKILWNYCNLGSTHAMQLDPVCNVLKFQYWYFKHYFVFIFTTICTSRV